MKTLNLKNNEVSDIKFEVSKFPDGQQQVRITSKVATLWKYMTLEMDSVQIKARLNNFKDLELIICATQSLKQLGIDDIHLYVPYFLGSRSDRQFNEGENNYLKHVICPIINSQGFKSVTVLDPHSDVLEACLNGFKKVSNKDLVHWAVSDILGKTITKDTNLAKWTVKQVNDPSYILVSPDAGAAKKIYKIAEQIGYTGDIITCSKDRDTNGKLTKCVVPITSKYLGKDIIIIDDICDGSNTFINIAKKIKEHFVDHGGTSGKIYLIVTHGIFSKGFVELSKYFDGIYCTNSYQDVSKNNSYHDHIDYGRKDFVKQLNVF